MNDQANMGTESTEASNVLQQVLDGLLGKILPHAGVRTVYGDPVVQGQRTVIPVAHVSYRFGFGAGAGTGNASADQAGKSGSRWGRRWRWIAQRNPLGYVEQTPDGARFVPIIDRTAIAMTVARMAALFLTATLLLGLRLSRARGSR